MDLGARSGVTNEEIKVDTEEWTGRIDLDQLGHLCIRRPSKVNGPAVLFRFVLAHDASLPEDFEQSHVNVVIRDDFAAISAVSDCRIRLCQHAQLGRNVCRCDRFGVDK